MSNMSLLTLPPEIVHCIFDHSDIQTILLSIRPVCKTLYNMVNIYNRFHLIFDSKLDNVMKSIVRLVRSENIIALTISGKNTIDSFYSLFSGYEFSRIDSLVLSEIKTTDLEQILQVLSKSPLISLVIKSYEKEQSKICSLVSSGLARWNLRKLSLTNINYMMKYVSWPIRYSLQELSFYNCTYSEYLHILHQLPDLQTLTMNDCTVNDTDKKLLTSSIHASLKSLVITDCSISTEEFELLLEPISELRNLKLISRKKKFDSMFDGCYWEKIIQIKLPYMEKFQFFLSYQNSKADNPISLESLVAPFRSPFWLVDKQWFVSCNWDFMRFTVQLHTTPLNVYEMDTPAVCQVSWKDNVHRLIKSNRYEKVDDTSDKTLTILDLYNHRMRDVGAKYVTDILKQNTTYTKLDLGQTDIGEIGSKYLADALRQNTTLTNINFSTNKIRDMGVEYLADVLRHNNTITELYLSNNEIGESRAQHLADALKQNTTLTRLSLGSNTVGQIGSKHLTDMLLQNKTIIRLDLGKNQIDAVGAKHLADTLRQNSTLIILDVQVNNIGDEGAQCLADALQKNTTIKELWVHTNNISNKLKSNLQKQDNRIQC